MRVNLTQERSGRGAGASRLAGNLTLIVAALLAGLLVCEILLRLFGDNHQVFVRADPIRGVEHIPGAKGSEQKGRRGQVEINSDGLRGPETTLKPPIGTVRIALLGDSFIEAFEVNYENTVGEVLERRLAAQLGAPVEVLNFGHGGYSTTQELLTLQHEVWKYSPDLILLAVTIGNDISDNYRPLKQTDYVPYHVFRGTELVVDTSFLHSSGYRSRDLWTRSLLRVVQHSRLVQLVNRARHLRRRAQYQQRTSGAPGHEVGLADEVQRPPKTPEWREAWRVTEGVLRLMRDECRRKQTPFALVTLTRGIQVSPDASNKERFQHALGVSDLYYPERRLAEFGKREGIPVLNLAPSMAEQAERRRVFFHADHGRLGVGHWNEEGHRAAGELIATWLGHEWRHLTNVAHQATP